MNLRHVPDIDRNEFNTPLLNDIFHKAQKKAAFETLCYINADVILMSDFMRAVKEIKGKKAVFTLAGAKREMKITELLDFNQPGWEKKLMALSKQSYSRPPENYRLGAEYFVFPRGFFTDIPPLALRWAWDGWLLRQARIRSKFLIDATPSVFAIHQAHDHSFIHRDDPRQDPWLAKEAMRNIDIAGIRRYWFLYEATHQLTPSGLKRLWFQKTLFRIKHALVYGVGPIRHRLGLRRRNLNRLKKFFRKAL